MEQPQLETLVLNNPNEDQESNSNMNESKSVTEDNHDKILHERTLLMEDLMD